MKKRLSAILLAFLLLFSSPVTAHASDSTYRWQLGSATGEIYDAIAANVPYGVSSFDYELTEPIYFGAGEDVNGELRYLVARAYEAFHRDHPEIFWLSKNGFSFSPFYHSDEDGVQITGFSMRIPLISSSYGSQQAELEQAVNSILAGASGSDYDKILYFHDTLRSLCVYDEASISSYSRPMAYESYGALVEGYALCEGYAKAFKLLCNRAGIDCELVAGTVPTGAHMWNYVYLDGAYYLVDVTFDDAAGVDPYAYFLRGYNSISDHWENNGMMEGQATDLAYPALSASDYAGGLPSAETNVPADLPGLDEPSDPVQQEEPAMPEWEPHQPLIPQAEEGFCRVSSLFGKNGRFLVKYIQKPGSLSPNEFVPLDTALLVLALPDAGYQTSSISVTGETLSLQSDGQNFLVFSPSENCRIQVVFEATS